MHMFKNLTPAKKIAVAVLSITAITLGATTVDTLRADIGSLPLVQTGVVGNSSATSASILGSINPYTYATSYYVEYGTTNALGSTSPSQTLSGQNTVPVSVSVLDLTPDTTYYYRLAAQNQNGTARGEMRTFRTTYSANDLGGAVTTNAVINPGAYTATLNGYVLDPGTNGGSAYFVYGTDRSDLSKTSDVAPIQDISYYRTTANRTPVYSINIANLTAGTTYFYKAAFRDTLGRISYGPIGSFTTGSAPAGSPATIPDSAAANPNAPIVSATNINGVSSCGAAVGTVVNANGFATSVWYEYGTTSSFGQKTPAYSAGSASFALPISNSVSGLIANTGYWMRAVAQNQNGIAYGPTATFTTPAGSANEEEEPVIIASVPRGTNRPVPPVPVSVIPAPVITTFPGANLPQPTVQENTNQFPAQTADTSKSIGVSSAGVANFILLILVLGLLVWIISRPRSDFGAR